MKEFKKILVTGGAGFCGSHFVDMCLEKGIQVVNYDAMKTGSMPEFGPDRVHPLYEFKQVDLSIDDYEIPYDVEAVVHLAAETHVDRSLSDPLSFINSNITGTYNLLNKMKSKNIRFHLVSTDEVYGDSTGSSEASTEDSPIVSSSPYSASKAASEQLTMAWARTYGLDCTITRGCNTIGARQNKEKLFPKFIDNAQKRYPLPVYGDGTAMRQYMHVSDHVDGIFTVLTKADTCRVYNLCSDQHYSINEIVAFLKQHYPTITVTDRENRPGHDMLYNISNASIKRDLEWETKINGVDILVKSFEELR